MTWLRRTKWNWFVTLAFAHGATVERAHAAVHVLLAALRAEVPRVYGVVAVEQGPALGGTHVHLLLGGLDTVPAWPAWVRARWGAWGTVHMTAYDPAMEPEHNLERGACAYLLKTWPDQDVEVFGRLRKWRPRRKR